MGHEKEFENLLSVDWSFLTKTFSLFDLWMWKGKEKKKWVKLQLKLWSMARKSALAAHMPVKFKWAQKYAQRSD